MSPIAALPVDSKLYCRRPQNLARHDITTMSHDIQASSISVVLDRHGELFLFDRFPVHEFYM